VSIDLHLGDELFGEIQSNCERRNEWGVSCPEAPEGWTGKLISRSDRLYDERDRDWFWVYRTNFREQRYWVSDSSFGRMPISDGLRPRYLRAARTLLVVLEPTWKCEISVVEDLAEMKGIFNRCHKKDQWDWLTLYHYLEDPPGGLLECAASLLHDVRRAIKRNETKDVKELLGRLQLAISPDLIRRFLARVKEASPSLPPARETPRRELDSIPANEPTGNHVSDEVKVKLERANQEHSIALSRLSAALEHRGYIVEHNKLIDAFCRLKTGPAIFEVKSITPSNERVQCRHALSQLYEYRYLHSMDAASLWLVLSSRPSAQWIVDYLMSDRNINLLWLEDGLVSGPSMRRLDAV
jgi:hypothetical protein